MVDKSISPEEYIEAFKTHCQELDLQVTGWTYGDLMPNSEYKYDHALWKGVCTYPESALTITCYVMESQEDVIVMEIVGDGIDAQIHRMTLHMFLSIDFSNMNLLWTRTDIANYHARKRILRLISINKQLLESNSRFIESLEVLTTLSK